MLFHYPITGDMIMIAFLGSMLQLTVFDGNLVILAIILTSVEVMEVKMMSLQNSARSGQRESFW